MRTLLVVLSIAVVFPACGSRSANFPRGARGEQADDGGSTSQDGSPRRDLGTPRDTLHPDSCLPVPSERVQGSYQGTWEGVVECFEGTPAEYIEGEMFFSLAPAGRPEAFNVRGKMSGQMFQMFKFSAAIEGIMSCVSLEANLPDITVQGSGLMLILTGRLSGVFTAQGFEGGSWEARGEEGDFPCVASGSWRADNE